MGTRIGIYPGTFDPITNGHMDIIERSLRIVDRLIVAIASNAGKNPVFSTAERVEIVSGEIQALVAAGYEVEVRPFDSLLMHFAASVNASVLIRGLRAVSDFDIEFQMAGMNSRLNPNIEIVFLMASEGAQFISSRFVKEIASLGGDVSSFVSPRVAERLRLRFPQKSGPALELAGRAAG
jgi:pantetheine-phosphate adenylyltransferase